MQELQSNIMTPTGPASFVGLADFAKDPARGETMARVRITTNDHAPRHLALVDGVGVEPGISECTVYRSSLPVIQALVAGPEDRARMAAAKAEYARRRSVEVREHLAKTDARFELGLTVEVFKQLQAERDPAVFAAEKFIDASSALSLPGTFHALHERDYPPLESVEIIGDVGLAPHHPSIERLALAAAIGDRAARPDAGTVGPEFVATAIAAALAPVIGELRALATAIAANNAPAAGGKGTK